jgi:phosphoribosylamine--glycine ligase
VDRFEAAGLVCLGPSQQAAQLEGSKVFCKAFLQEHSIPTARYQAFTDLTQAQTYLKNQAFPLVIKADGLAAGKGVVIAHDEQKGLDALEQMLAQQGFGDAGQQVVIEGFLVGEEASFIVLVDGEHCLPLATSQDHKARDEGDQGPNTGGMGAYSPAPVVTPTVHQRIMEQVIRPTIKGMQDAGHPYRGFLYAGLMIDPQGQPKVLEFNCRLGDPETQPLLMRLTSDLVPLCLATVNQQLADVQAEWDPRPALGVVLAAKGYPFNYSKGEVISGIKQVADDSNCKLFHAGTVLHNNQVITQGGRVLCATALGNDLLEAQSQAYQLARQVVWPNAFYRKDIGHRAMHSSNREGKNSDLG